MISDEIVDTCPIMSLVKLILRNTGVRVSPSSIGRLESLQELVSLEDEKQPRHLPEEIGNETLAA